MEFYKNEIEHLVKVDNLECVLFRQNVLSEVGGEPCLLFAVSITTCGVRCLSSSCRSAESMAGSQMDRYLWGM